MPRTSSVTVTRTLLEFSDHTDFVVISLGPVYIYWNATLTDREAREQSINIRKIRPCRSTALWIENAFWIAPLCKRDFPNNHFVSVSCGNNWATGLSPASSCAQVRRGEQACVVCVNTRGQQLLPSLLLLSLSSPSLNQPLPLSLLL